MSGWDDYWTALAEGDRDLAITFIQRALDEGAAPREVLDEFVLEAQHRIGELWLEGEWTVAQEHEATAVSESLVHWLASVASRPPTLDGRALLVSCLPGERHALPALVVAEGLRMEGHRVHYLGADPEPSSLLSEVLDLGPRAVLFSGSLTSALGTQKSMLVSLRALGVPVVVGGQAFGLDARRARSLGATAHAPSIEAVVEVLDRLPARLPRLPDLEAVPGEAEGAWLEDARPELAAYVVRQVRRRVGDEGGTPDWWTDYESNVDHLVGCLGAALVTGDDTIMLEVREWMARMLTRRDAPPTVMELTWDTLAGRVRGHPMARLLLASA